MVVLTSKGNEEGDKNNKEKFKELRKKLLNRQLNGKNILPVSRFVRFNKIGSYPL